MSTLIACTLITASTISLDAAEQALSWTPEAVMSTQMISDVQLSPDNQSVLFVATTPKMSEEKGILVSRIYKGSSIHDESPVPFSAINASSTHPRWSPNCQWIAFLSNREGTKNLYLIRTEGGESIPLTKGKADIQTFAWSPDGKKIAYVMADETTTEKNRKKTSLAYVYKQPCTINRLWLIDVFASEPTPQPLTSDDYCVRGMGDFGTLNTDFDWSPDSKEIVFAYSPGVGFDDFHLDSSLAIVNTSTGTTVPLKKNSLYEATPRFSPNGHWIAFLSSHSSDRCYAVNRQVTIRSKNGLQQHSLSKTFNEGAFSMGPNILGWSQDGNHVLFFEPKGTKFHVVYLPVDGQPAKELDTGGVFFKEPALSYDRTMLSFVVQTPSNPPEAFVSQLDDFVPIQVSALNHRLLSYPKTETQVLSWSSSVDGLKIEGLLTYPIDYEEGKQYPLVLVIHGGPMGFFDETFLGTPNPYPLASFAQAGFMVLRPNPRGSSGYGKDFRCANYRDWGGADLADLLSGIDNLIAKGLVDAERLGVMGWSYGGYLTARAITQTSRFKAASTGAGLCNLVSLNGTTDMHHFLTDYLGDFTDNRELYEERSPINHASNVKTPCLIQHGTEDKRVPVSQAYEFYHALDRVGQNPMLILYPGMEHRLTDPKMQLDAMERNLAWFQKYLSEDAIRIPQKS